MTLSLLLLLPFGGAIVAACVRGSLARRVAQATFLAVLAVATVLALPLGTNPTPAIDLPLAPALGVRLHFALDGLNLYFVLLTAVVFPAAMACIAGSREGASRLFAAGFTALQGLLLGTFLARDLVVLFSLWEAVLLPAVVLLLVFGGPARRRAAMAFFLYTMAGSVPMLAAVILLGAQAQEQLGRWTFDLATLSGLRLDPAHETFVFAAFVLASAVKSPLVPFHAWLPLAYREAPSPVTAVMAGVMSKMGAFGFLALAIPLCPNAAALHAPAMMAWAAASIAYGAVVALRQAQPKSLVAYASLSHMGYIVLGAFALRATATHGALFQVLSHGLSVAGLFLVLGLLEQRRGAVLVGEALAARAPRFAVVLMLFVLASLALPLTSGFTAEFLVLTGAWDAGLHALQAGEGGTGLVAAAVASAGVVLGATYMLRLARQVVFGEAPAAQPPADLRRGEMAAFAAMLVLVAWIGAWPAPWMAKVDAAVARELRHE